MTYSLPRIGSSLIVKNQDKILLVKRNKNPMRGKFVIPGGKIEPFESIANAGIREIKEETGLDVEVIEQICTVEIIVPEKEHRIVIYSWATIIGGELIAGSDSLEPNFYSKCQIEKLDLTDTVREVLKKIDFISKD